MLRLSRAHFPVTALGPGRRLGIWVQGCPLACPGCMSLDTWAPDAGVEVDEGELVELWRTAIGEGAEGMTISGGEPLAQAEGLTRFLLEANRMREGVPDPPDFLLYTGYELTELSRRQRAVLDLVDAVITGRYDIRRPTRLIWRGSANQELVARTELGRARYAEYVDRVPLRPPMQLAVDAGRLWVVGVPPAGALHTMERAVRARGIQFEEVAWRP